MLWQRARHLPTMQRCASLTAPATGILHACPNHCLVRRVITKGRFARRRTPLRLRSPCTCLRPARCRFKNGTITSSVASSSVVEVSKVLILTAKLLVVPPTLVSDCRIEGHDTHPRTRFFDVLVKLRRLLARIFRPWLFGWRGARTRSMIPASTHKPHRIDHADRIAFDIAVGINPPLQPNRVRLHIPPRGRIVVPVPVVERSPRRALSYIERFFPDASTG